MKRRGWAAGRAAGLRRAMPTTPNTVTSVRAERGTKMRSVLEFRSGGRDLEAVVEQGEEVVGDHAFEGLAVDEAQADPEAVEFGAA